MRTTSFLLGRTLLVSFNHNNTDRISDVRAHRQRRKLFARGYSQAAMMEYEPNISNKIDILLKQWKARSADGPIDVYPWLHWFAFDVVCKWRVAMLSGYVSDISRV